MVRQTNARQAQDRIIRFETLGSCESVRVAGARPGTFYAADPHRSPTPRYPPFPTLLQPLRRTSPPPCCSASCVAACIALLASLTTSSPRRRICFSNLSHTSASTSSAILPASSLTPSTAHLASRCNSSTPSSRSLLSSPLYPSMCSSRSRKAVRCQ